MEEHIPIQCTYCHHEQAELVVGTIQCDICKVTQKVGEFLEGKQLDELYARNAGLEASNEGLRAVNAQLKEALSKAQKEIERLRPTTSQGTSSDVF
ncbi:MAG: hypothetical protein U1D69_13315 [Polynucleobacter sp.]|nr:hypothetical protein [Polynucleobacter sp.]